VSPRKVLAIARKELRQASRDPLSLAMLMGVPAMTLVMYGYAINFDVRHARLAVLDRDKSAASRELVSSFVNSTFFDQVADLTPGDDLGRLTERREAKAVLVIPEGFARERAAGRRAPVQFIVDGTDANTATTLLGYASAIAGEVSARGAALETDPPITYEPRVWYNPELRSTQFLVPGLVGFILMLTAVVSTALSVVRERERGTMEQLRVSALRPSELIVGKVLPFLGISLGATFFILSVARVLFGVVVRGSYLDLFVVTLIYLLGALGFGLLVSTLVETQAMAFQVGMVTSMLPAIFLSGFIFPIKSMPFPVQIVSYAVPARYFNVVLRGIILKGGGLASYWDDVLFLVAFAVVVMGIAARRLSRREA
jgi:ABC-2 type transport system permease protein